jgi:hypothetical protein
VERSATRCRGPGARSALGLAASSEAGGGAAERSRGQAGTADRLAGWHVRGVDASASEPCLRAGAGAARPKGACDCVL